MLEPRTLTAIGVVLTVAALFVILTRMRRTSGKQLVESTANQTNARVPESTQLRALAMERADYTIHIGIPAAAPTHWQTVEHAADESLTLDDGTVVSYANVQAFAVTYPNGQLVEYVSHGLPLPKGVSGLSQQPKADDDVLNDADLIRGKNYIQIRYRPCPAHPNDTNHYSTTLTNVSDEPIRVERFAGYTKTADGWWLSTVTKNFYSAEEFVEWYGLRGEKWIQPGMSATDANNYGTRPVLWAYYCQSKSGQQFIAGESLE